MISRDDISAHRLYTEITGALNQTQIKSVNSWPLVAFKDLKKHETRINPETCEVEYVLTLKPKKSIKDFKMLKIVEESVWALLGDNWKTTFRVGKRILYVGARRREIRNDDRVSFGQGRAGFDPSRA